MFILHKNWNDAEKKCPALKCCFIVYRDSNKLQNIYTFYHTGSSQQIPFNCTRRWKVKAWPLNSNRGRVIRENGTQLKYGYGLPITHTNGVWVEQINSTELILLRVLRPICLLAIAGEKGENGLLDTKMGVACLSRSILSNSSDSPNNFSSSYQRSKVT